ncbi:uncharacterized protein LOC143248885 isoform X2 [Tachypleus tridentatus]|uniref:uncharacterized protein LOC143248885 isoform X2 n=1 Tax=Tachypleus tridentatus TaxID=6853 RepID=UPI003FD092AA
MSQKKHHCHITRKLMSSCTAMYVFLIWSIPQVTLAHKMPGLTKFQAPQNFAVKNIDKNSFTLTWKKPAPAGDKNTQLMAFSLSYNSVDEISQECNCSEPGMVACTRMHGTVECTCFPGYTGKWCESCSSGYYRDEKECKPCPCVNVTSSGNCILDKAGQVTCTSCLPGHRGLLCNDCVTGYHWQEDQCVALNCLSLSICAEQQDDPDCSDCIFLTRTLAPPTAQKSSAPTIADGTIPLIAVIVTLGVILLVAGSATCYRYWSYRRSRPRLPFWSVELREEKLNLSSEYQYEHLDAATSKVIQAITTNDVEPDNFMTAQPSLTSFKKCYKSMEI